MLLSFARNEGHAGWRVIASRIYEDLTRPLAQ
jgi:hypothetical protein